jgi:hypothetical protein
MQLSSEVLWTLPHPERAIMNEEVLSHMGAAYTFEMESG